MPYQSRHAGVTIDDTIDTVVNNASTWSGKQDKLTGINGQIVMFDEAGNPAARDMPAVDIDTENLIILEGGGTIEMDPAFNNSDGDAPYTITFTLESEDELDDEYESFVGNSIVSILQTERSTEDEGDNEITITTSDGAENKFYVRNGSKGSDGVGIQSIDKTAGSGAAGTTDTYTITFTDNSTFDFRVYNGRNGTSGSGSGSAGADGLTPYIGGNGNWFIGDEDTGVRAKGEDGANGLTPYIGANGNWYVGNEDTGVQAKGKDGADGISPHIGVNGNWYVGTLDTGVPATGSGGTSSYAPEPTWTLIVAPSNGVEENTLNIDVYMDGVLADDRRVGVVLNVYRTSVGEWEFYKTISVIGSATLTYDKDWKDAVWFARIIDNEKMLAGVVVTAGGGGTGEDGRDGTTPHIGENGNWYIGELDTGVRAEGVDGADGYVPIRGVDYWTAADKAEIIDEVTDELLGSGLGGLTPGVGDSSMGSSVVGIQSVTQTITSEDDGGTNQITVRLTDGSSSIFEVKNGSTGSQGPEGEKGDKGDQGDRGYVFTPSVSSSGVLSWTNDGGLTNPPSVNIKGSAGAGVSSIDRTSGDGTSGVTDTYTITMTDGNTSTFTVYNGKDGTNGVNGADGTPADIWTLDAAVASGSEENTVYVTLYKNGVEYTEYAYMSTLVFRDGDWRAHSAGIGTITGTKTWTYDKEWTNVTWSIRVFSDSTGANLLAATSVTVGGGGGSFAYSADAPKAAGVASAGSATTVSRSDHVHPEQTTITGNAGSATKLATARTIHTNLESTNSYSFDGTANITPGVTGTLPIANGGTGATTAAAALAALGAAASDHTHSASKISYGTFTGTVSAGSSAQTPTSLCLRNSKIVAASSVSSTTLSNNGSIIWGYE